MPGLSKLFLAINRITYLPPRTFENLNKLDELVVSSNMIQYLPMDAFFGLLSLTKLDLSSNKILFINDEAFQPLQALKYLLLFQNRLTTLPGLPNSITFLFLHRNPWVCNCQLIHSMELMQAKIQSPAGVTCKRPPFLAGHPVTRSKLLGCTSSPTSYLSSSLFSTIDFLPSNSGNVKLIYSLLGGFFLGLTAGLFCCYCLPKCCSCRRSANQPKNEKTFSSNWVKPSANEEEKPSERDSQILCSLPVAESSAVAFEGGHIERGTCCGQLGCASQICYTEQVRFQRPLVAYLSLDAMGRSIVTLHEKGNEARCPVFSQPCCQAPRENTERVTEVSGDGGNQEQHCTKCMHGLNGSCVLPTAMDQIERKQSGLGQQVDTQLYGQTLHPKIHLRDTQPLQALVHIDFPDGSAMKIEQNRATSCKSPPKMNESHQSRSHIPASPRWSRRKRENHGQPHHHSQAGFTSPENHTGSDVRPWQASWTGGKDPRRPDLYLSFASKPNKSQRWKHSCPHPTHEVTTTPSLSSISSQPEANKFHYLKEPCPECFSVTRRPGKRARSSPYLDKTPLAGEMILTHRKSRSRQEDPVISFTRNGSTLSRIWKCQNCGWEGSVPCSINQRRLAQPGVVPRSSRTFLDVSTQWSSTDAVRLKESKVALTFLGVPPNVAKTLSEERWLAACLPGYQPTSALTNHAGDVDSIYEYPSPLVSTTALNTASSFVEMTATEPTLKNQNQGMDCLQIRETTPVAVTDHSVDLLPPNRIGIRGLSEEIQHPESLLEIIAVGTEQSSEEGEKDAVSLSSNASGYFFRTGTKPSLQELPVSVTRCSKVTFSDTSGHISQKTPSITSICPLVQKMYQIDFPLPVEEAAKPSSR
ncbi:uncharacterized protein PHA67_001884 [Liasis olivaceus]